MSNVSHRMKLLEGRFAVSLKNRFGEDVDVVTVERQYSIRVAIVHVSPDEGRVTELFSVYMAKMQFELASDEAVLKKWRSSTFGRTKDLVPCVRLKEVL